jgi:hypothetical protein
VAGDRGFAHRKAVAHTAARQLGLIPAVFRHLRLQSTRK